MFSFDINKFNTIQQVYDYYFNDSSNNNGVVEHIHFVGYDDLSVAYINSDKKRIEISDDRIDENTPIYITKFAYSAPYKDLVLHINSTSLDEIMPFSIDTDGIVTIGGIYKAFIESFDDDDEDSYTIFIKVYDECMQCTKRRTYSMEELICSINLIDSDESLLNDLLFNQEVKIDSIQFSTINKKVEIAVLEYCDDNMED